MRLLLACLFALVAAVSPALSQGDGLGDLMPPGAYGQALHQALITNDFDFAALRASYAADPAFTGRSRLKDREAEALLASQSGTPAPEWSGDDVLRAIFADFPLLDTQLAAYRYYKSSKFPKADRMVKSHAAFYQGFLEAILATRREGKDGPVYKVLSISEEYAVLQALELGSARQALLNIDGVPHDRHDTAKGPVYFDISAFFGR